MIAEIAGLILFLALFSVLILGSQAVVTPKTGSLTESIESPAGNIEPNPNKAEGFSSLALSSSE
jgi:hypothetical protein